MSEVEKMYEKANIKPEYRYDCNLADTIKPVEVFPLHSCSKGEIKDYCTNRQDYQYCKVYKVNKIYPPFTTEKQIELIKWFVKNNAELETLEITYYLNDCFQISSCAKSSHFETNFEDAIAGLINNLWQDLTEEEKQQVKGILE